MKKRVISYVLAITMVASVATGICVSAKTEVETGTVITLPANSVIVDGGFETATYDNPTAPTKANIPTFTATEDKGLSTERVARNAQIITEAGIPLEGKQCVFMLAGENLTIALPNLKAYAGGKLEFVFYARGKVGNTGFGTWGKVEDRAQQDEVVDQTTGAPIIDPKTEKPQTKPHVVQDFSDGMSYWTDKDTMDIFGKWIKCEQIIDIPATIADKNEYVINFGTYGTGVGIYYDALSCVIKDAAGVEVPASTFATPTPAPTVAPTATPTNGGDETPDSVKKAVKFSKKTAKVKAGKTATLKVNVKAKFSVNKKKILKLLTKKAAKAAKVKGLKKGIAIVTAKASGKKATCKVTVKK